MPAVLTIPPSRSQTSIDINDAASGADALAQAERAELRLPEGVRHHLGEQLRALYAPPDARDVPETIRLHLDRLDAVLTARGEALTEEVRSGMAAVMPNLLAYAISLTKDRALAEDLVQETLLKGWRSRHRYQAGTNVAAWLTTILRNNYYTVYRKRAREVEDADDTLAAALSVAPAQSDRLNLQDVQAALAKLPVEQREALLLVVLNELTYDEAAALMGCKVGTVKSRISRGQNHLAKILGYAGGVEGDWLTHLSVHSVSVA
jgi:RNA polymerase sigma factor (sigma-70 family)